MAVDEQIQDSPDVGTPAPPQTDPVEKYYNYLKSAGADVPPSLDSFKKTLSNDSTAQKYYSYLRQNKFDTPPTYGSFARTLGITQAASPSPAPAAAPPPLEHQIQHDPIQDIRHIQEMAGKPAPQGYSTATGGMGGGGTYVAPDPTELAQYKGYQDQYT